MKHQLKTAILTATLSLSSILALDITAQALPPVDTTVENSNSSTVPPVENSDSSTMPSAEEANAGTQFTCVPQNDGSVATVGQRPGGQAIPLIIWTAASSKYFGEKFTPQGRCQIVTPKLNQAVAESGGRLKDVVLMTGRFKKNTVICVVSAKDTGCNGRNTLFTLKPENAKQADKILAQIMQISREGSGAGVIRETQGRVQIKLTDLLKNNVNGLVQQPIRKPAVQNQSGGL
ncbi:COP23 domain-containing protein [Dolichospermum sp. ST_sed1]|nr:COP23 domain-containing protein [Dolichospermum sp. ST_sed1]MDD1427727.1 COP23 domain-containing protein [Dolichospermum sp. ST_sed9]MDD1434091.1 COP23 domain-containing protein [Dolichospermum sp. ST_sed6]MDD1437839.1 COP23 domain-containing protein [Dolichospermum sp. ST_sed10]MDD1443395.1 COP23 domain-containing protein [Dolichospermum sp. ST_sed3]MDD1445181.1 COP23 domain-containing protein [Dolichospermum sp. ST_sed8]MDD1457677.1 COP23 domain-containing protein [Dolichospermum sp. ST_